MLKYTPGDTIQVDIELEDENEIAQVKLVFSLDSNPGKKIEIAYTGEPFSGETTFYYEVFSDAAPGTYSLKEFYAVDTKNNRSFLDASLEFEIENDSVDVEGPKLIDVELS